MAADPLPPPAPGSSGAPGPGGLHHDEVARVLARAVELAAHDHDGPDGVPVWVVEAAAAEVGVEATAVRRAVAELRAGALPAPTGPPAPGACGTVTVRRHLAQPPGVVADAVGAFLARQLFTPRRQQEAQQRWCRRRDVVSGVRRATDVRGRLCLDGVEEVVVRLVPLEPGVVVHLEARLASGWVHAGWWGAVPGVVGGTAGAVVALTTGVPDVAAVVAGPAGALASGAGVVVGRRLRAGRRAEVADQLEGALDVVARAGQSGPPAGLLRAQLLVRERWAELRRGSAGR